MKKQIALAIIALLFAVSSAYGQKTEPGSACSKFQVGSTFLLLGNFLPSDPNPPDFVQLNFGYRITPKSVVAIEVKTWKYAWPLGIPYGRSFEAPDEKYPGYVRAFGMAFVYQHFWWKGAYTSIHAMHALQRYMGEDHEHMRNGYQLFMTYRLGYHLQLFNNRFFVEPSLAVTHWPINTNVPEAFAALEKKWPNYFLLEPGLHFGLKF